MLIGNRHLVVLLRKREMCQCGCRGWCSLFPVFLFLKWSLAAMKAGVHPHARHDATVFSPEDVVRSLLAGSALGWKAVVVLIKVDWAEFAVRLGFPTWSSKNHPCMLRHASRDDLFSFIGYSALGMPSPPNCLLRTIRLAGRASCG